MAKRRRPTNDLDKPVKRPGSLRRRAGQKHSGLGEPKELREPTPEEREWADGVAARAKDSDLLSFFTAQALRTYADAMESGVLKPLTLLSDLALDAVAAAEGLPTRFDHDYAERQDKAFDVWFDGYKAERENSPSRCPTCRQPWPDVPYHPWPPEREAAEIDEDEDECP